MNRDEEAESSHARQRLYRCGARGIRRRLVKVREFGRETPRVWALYHSATLPRWPDRLPGKLRYRLWPKRGKVRGHSNAYFFNFTIYKRSKRQA
jgi:hypothetical protein